MINRIATAIGLGILAKILLGFKIERVEEEPEVLTISPEMMEAVADAQKFLVELCTAQRLNLIEGGFSDSLAEQMAGALYISMINTRS